MVGVNCMSKIGERAASESFRGVSVSPVASQAYINITHQGIISEPDIGMNSPILRIPEFVKRGGKRRPPGYTDWEIVRMNKELRYRWAAPRKMKEAYGTDFWGSVKVEGDEVLFEVTDQNIGDEPAVGGLHLFCLQAGLVREFQDCEGRGTFVWVNDRFVSVHDLIGGHFPEHRMVGFRCVSDKPAAKEVTRKLIVRRSEETGFVLALALDRCASVAGNYQPFPCCMHTNPDWGELHPGESATVRGKVYFFRGTLDQVLERYVRDFEQKEIK